MPPFALRCFLFALGLLLECRALAVVQSRSHQLSALKTHADLEAAGNTENSDSMTIDFSSAFLAYNSLGSSGRPQMRFMNVGSYRRPGSSRRTGLMLMMLEKNKYSYDGNVSKTLVNGGFAHLNVGNNRTVEFGCFFLDQESEEPVKTPKFNFSFWDLDMGKYGGVESITVGPISAYYTTKESDVLAKQISDTEWSFTATKIGKYIDNPYDTNNATSTDLNRALVVEFEVTGDGAYQFDITFSVGPSELASSYPKSGRTFLFGGNSVQPAFDKHVIRDFDSPWRTIPNNFPFPSGMKIALQSDTGKWMTRCRSCQRTPKISDTATVHVESPLIIFAQFTVVNMGGGKIALKSDNGKYAARCRDCIVGGSLDSLAIHVDDPNLPIAQFTPEVQANGKYALKADTGNYVSRCRDCSPRAAVSDTVTFDARNSSQASAQWTIYSRWFWIRNDFQFPTDIKIALQSDTGKWMTRCRGCQQTRFADTATVHVESPSVIFAQFTVVNMGGGKIALRSDNGKYAARCRDCIAGGSLDSLAIHVDDPNLPIAQFTPEVQANGKYALKADTGSYVSRCRDCSPGAAVSDTITFDASSSSESRAQWSIWRFFMPEWTSRPV